MLWHSVNADILENNSPSINNNFSWEKSRQLDIYNEYICVVDMLQNCFIFIKTIEIS